MPTRNYSQPSTMGISPQLSDILLKNGMRAQVVLVDNKLKLAVEGHDSPTLFYDISEAQLRKLSRAGGATGSDLKAAYKTFTAIVGKDFYMPVDLTHAKNVNNRVSMGLHGYRVGYGEYGSNPSLYRPVLAWTPRQQGGFHLRRMAGTVFYGGGPFVPDRPGSQVKPGELAAGDYGFYWKGTANGQNLVNATSNGANPALNQDSQQYLLDQLSNIKIQSIKNLPKPKKYTDEITSDVYFTSGKFLEILTSHGILINQVDKTMTIRSEAVNFDMDYTLTDQDLDILTDPFPENHSIQERIDLINNLCGKDFKQQITFADLDSENPLNIEVADHVRTLIQSTPLSAQMQNGAYAAYNQNTDYGYAYPANQTIQTYQTKQGQYQNTSQQLQQMEPQLVSQQISRQGDGTTQIYVPESHDVDAQEYYRVQSAVLHADPKQVAQVNGEDLNYLNPEKGWYREGNHGRAVTVDQIIVYPIEENDNKEKYMMTAVIDGEMISHKISQKDYDKFLVLDDFHRMKLFSKVFPEVDLKDNNQVNLGTKIVAGIAAGLTVASEVVSPGHPYYGRGGGSVYFKPGVDTPSDIAHRAFEAGMNTERMDQDLHHGW